MEKNSSIGFPPKIFFVFTTRVLQNKILGLHVTAQYNRSVAG